jgi:two-component system response regulator PilR (NtrC family)
MGSILVVDDERSMREFMSICLRRAGHKVTLAEGGETALATLDPATPFDLVITDLKMPGKIDGLGVLREVKAKTPSTQVILVTAFATAETALSAMKQGAYDYLTKPFKIDEIQVVVERALERQALATANAELRELVHGRYRLGSILGKSPAMQKVFDMLRKVAVTRTSVLLTGESGTGKELAARALHAESPRTGAPFVAVNCGAIPETLIESELFGHVRGAFTGATGAKDGLFVAADGGTLFLDEIGELPLAMQVKLLRALQERRVKPVGATDEIAVDVRLVAATNRDLDAEVARGAFRQDLYYRLNVIQIHLPPLRARREDLPFLIDHFIKRYAGELDKRCLGITSEALSALMAYDFPGNVRELENLIERAVTLESGSVIGRDSLPELARPGRTSERDGEDVTIGDGFDLDRVVADYERAIVQKALQQAQGVRKEAARLLGITFRSLRYRLAKLGIDSESALEPDLDG